MFPLRRDSCFGFQRKHRTHHWVQRDESETVSEGAGIARQSRQCFPARLCCFHLLVGCAACDNEISQKWNVSALSFVRMALFERVFVHDFNLIPNFPLFVIEGSEIGLRRLHKQRTRNPFVTPLWGHGCLWRIPNLSAAAKKMNIAFQLYCVRYGAAEVFESEDENAIIAEVRVAWSVRSLWAKLRFGNYAFEQNYCSLRQGSCLFGLRDSSHGRICAFLGSFGGIFGCNQACLSELGLSARQSVLKDGDKGENQIKESEQGGVESAPIERRGVLACLSLGICSPLCWLGSRLIDRGWRYLGWNVCGLGLSVFYAANILLCLSSNRWSCCCCWGLCYR